MADLTCPHCRATITKRELDCARFDSQVQASGDCWEWTGARETFGYGVFGAEGHSYLAHRWQWARHNGPIPKGKMVMHACDNPPCVNPAHLSIGTQKDNMADKMARGRHRFGILRGVAHGRAKLTEADVLEIRRLAAEGRSAYRIAQIYGMGKTSIRHIIKRINWPHI